MLKGMSARAQQKWSVGELKRTPLSKEGNNNVTPWKVAHASSCPGVRLVDNWWTAGGQLDTPGQLMDMYSSTPSTDSYPLAPSHFRVDKNTNKDISADEFKRKVQDHNMTLIKPN